MAYLSKRTGEEVDALLDKVERGGSGIEVDTSLSETSNNAVANSAVTNALNDKVDKVEGKGLSTNDFTDEYKAKVEDIGDNTIIVDYDRIAELKASEENNDVRHPEIAELVRKLIAEQEKLILVRTMKDKHEGTNPTYYVPDTNYSYGEFGQIIELYASYTGISDGDGKQRHDSILISLESDGKIWAVKSEASYILSEKSVVDSLTSNSKTLPISARQGRVLKQELDKKPNSDGYYPDMSVGMSDNLVGRGDLQDAQINFRPSAGADNITDGAARIEKIKGNSVVYNQLVKNADFRNGTSGWVKNNTTLTMNDDGSMRITNNSGNSQGITQYIAIPAKRKILIIADFRRSSLTESPFVVYMHKAGGGGYDISRLSAYSDVARTKKTLIIESTAIIDQILIYPFITGEVGSYADIYSCVAIDLTQMFGVGNEPATVAEYRQRKPMNIEDEFAYNAGELVDMKVDSLISTSDNAYDYTKGYARVMGGHTYDCSYGTAFVEKVYFSTDKDNIVAEENAMTSENGKYIFPSDGYAVPYTTDGDVREYCVCLQHSYTKPHPPYQQEVKDLSFIGKAFSEGMRSAGSAFDEIRFNPTKKVWEKVTRIGKVDLGSLTYRSSDNNVYYASIADCKYRFQGITTPYIATTKALGDLLDKEWTSQPGVGTFIWLKDSNYTTAAEFKASLNGVMLYYELAEPIVVDIPNSENLNLDYRAWDFGTEEAIASVPSAPFRADINYEPNAVDDLRWAVAEIRNLKAQLAQMSASVTNLTE